MQQRRINIKRPERTSPLNLQEFGSTQLDSLADPRSPLNSQFLFHSPAASFPPCFKGV